LRVLSSMTTSTGPVVGVGRPVRGLLGTGVGVGVGDGAGVGGAVVGETLGVAVAVAAGVLGAVSVTPGAAQPARARTPTRTSRPSITAARYVVAGPVEGTDSPVGLSG
jgi:hypothetical protein